MSSTRLSLHIGINGYAPTIGRLQYCVADVTDTKSVLDSRRDGFNSTRSLLLVDEITKGEEGVKPPTRASRVEEWRGCLGLAYLLPALSLAGASLALPCPVSTPRS